MKFKSKQPNIIKKVLLRTGTINEVKTFWGQTIYIIPGDDVSKNIAYNGFHEEDTTNYLLQNLKEGDTFIDVGAHIGYFSLFASHIVGEGGFVHSFEPSECILELCNKNINQKINIVLNNVAILDHIGMEEFKDFGIKNSAFNSFIRHTQHPKLKGKKYYVDATTIDIYVKENKIKPDMIKIDVENTEIKVLQGAIKTIEKHKPKIVLETNKKSCILFLTNRGYEVFDYSKGKITPHKIKEIFNNTNLLFIKK